MFTNFGPKYNLNTIFLITSKKKIRWFSFVNNVSKYIKALHDKGIRKGDNVAIDLENSVEYIYSVFALWYIEATPVLLNVRLLEKEKLDQFEFTKSKFLISTNKYSSTSKALIINPLELQLTRIKFKRKKLDLNHTAIIIFTSGSSGKPKGVMLSFNNLIANDKASEELLNYSLRSSWIASLPFYHIGGFSIITRSYLSNLKLILPDSLSTNDIQKAFEKHHPSFASFVSTQLINLTLKNFSPGRKFKKLLLGGGFIRNNLIGKGNKLGWNILKVYGTSETTAFVTSLDTNKYKMKMSSAGKPIKGYLVEVIKENKNEGEVIVKGPSVFKGYYNNEEETKKKLINGYYHTGDIGYKDDDGFVHVLARRNDLIISGGENINPFEIEDTLTKHPNIYEAYVVGIEDEKWGQVPAAAIRFKGKKLTLEEINEFLKVTLPTFKLLKKIKEVSDFPRTSLHKIKRDELKNLF